MDEGRSWLDRAGEVVAMGGLTAFLWIWPWAIAVLALGVGYPWSFVVLLGIAFVGGACLLKAVDALGARVAVRWFLTAAWVVGILCDGIVLVLRRP